MEKHRKPSTPGRHLVWAAALCALAFLLQSRIACAAAPSAELIADLQDELGLSKPQVRGALGALLVFARDRLPQTQFNDLAGRMPNAEQIMQQVKARGIVTRSLDDLDDYEEVLSHNLDIAPPLASRFAPAVLEWLAAKGYDTERDILAGALD